VIAFMIRRRTREIGIRMALGARPQDVLCLFRKQGVRLAGAGCGAGLLALASTRVLAAFLYGVPARDPVAPLRYE
jgi:putative ABC transport system permease protein